MIGHLRGTLLEQGEQTLIIDVGGVGYEVFVGDARQIGFGEVGGDVAVWVYTYVREDQITLFGFKEALQKKLFLILIGINGIGPKLALAVLGTLSSAELVEAVTTGNTKPLRGVSGVGPKMADRMVLELKDKLAVVMKMHEWTGGTSSDANLLVWSELSDALTGLGFAEPQIRNVIKLLRSDQKDAAPDINQLLKLALQKIKDC